jgi:hypothetical protein
VQESGRKHGGTGQADRKLWREIAEKKQCQGLKL